MSKRLKNLFDYVDRIAIDLDLTGYGTIEERYKDKFRLYTASRVLVETVNAMLERREQLNARFLEGATSIESRLSEQLQKSNPDVEKLFKEKADEATRLYFSDNQRPKSLPSIKWAKLKVHPGSRFDDLEDMIHPDALSKDTHAMMIGDFGVVVLRGYKPVDILNVPTNDLLLKFAGKRGLSSVPGVYLSEKGGLEVVFDGAKELKYFTFNRKHQYPEFGPRALKLFEESTDTLFPLTCIHPGHVFSCVYHKTSRTLECYDAGDRGGGRAEDLGEYGNKILELMGGTQWKVKVVFSSCLMMGPQTRLEGKNVESTGFGLCTTWAIMFLVLRIFNPKKTCEQVAWHIDSMTKEDALTKVLRFAYTIAMLLAKGLDKNDIANRDERLALVLKAVKDLLDFEGSESTIPTGDTLRRMYVRIVERDTEPVGVRPDRRKTWLYTMRRIIFETILNLLEENVRLTNVDVLELRSKLAQLYEKLPDLQVTNVGVIEEVERLKKLYFSKSRPKGLL